MTPFKGLAAFTDSDVDAQFFFGRERDIQTIAANLIASRFTLLYGASGVGKSSVLAAGVVRRLRELAPDALVVACRDWTSGEPLASLAGAVPDLETGSGRSLADSLADLVERRGSEIYLALDQFEDVFVHQGSAAFVRALAEVVTRPGLRVHALVSVREDALSELDVFTGLIPNVFGNYLPLDPLDREGGRLAITGPVARMLELEPAASLEIEPGLVEAVLDQTAIGRVALGGVALGAVGSGVADRIEAPYLQLVMQRLWEAELEQDSGVLRRATLEGLGGARGILRAHLERALGALEPDERDAAARMFHHLVTPSGTKIAHRVTDLAEYAAVPVDVVRRVLAKLAPRRIVRPLDGSVELYHDVLADAVLAWRTQHDAEQRLAEQHAAAVTRQRRLAVAVAVCLVALAAMTALAVYALAQRSDARSNADAASVSARQAGAKRLDAIASSLIPVAKVRVDPELGLLLAARAARVAPDPPADDILRRALLMSFVRRVLPDRNVTATVYAPEVSRLAVATHAGIVRVYGPDLRTPLAAVRAGAPIVAVAMSRDGRRLVTMVDAGRAILWDVKTGQRIASLPRAPTSAAFSPDGRLLVTTERRVFRVWSATDGALLATRTLPAHITLATFTPAGDRVVAAAGRIVRTFLPSGEPAGITVDHGARVTSVAVTADGRTLVTAGNDHVVRVWSLLNGRPERDLTGHRTDVTSLALNPNRPVLVSTSTGGTARLWDLRTRQFLYELTGHINRVTGAAFDGRGAHLVTWSTDGTARVWNVDDGRAMAVLPAGDKPVTSAAFGPNGVVITTAGDGLVKLWRPQLTPRLRLVARVGTHARAAAFTRSGRRVVVATAGRLVVLDSRGRRLLQRHVSTAAQAVAISDDGRRFAYATGRRVVVARVEPGHPDETATVPSAPAALALAPGGRRLAVGTATGAVLLRRLGTGTVSTLPGDDAAVTSLAFSPAGDRIAAGHRRGFVTVWRASGGAPLFSRLTHTAGTAVLGVAFSRSGRLVVTAGHDSDVRIVAAGDGQPVADLSGHFNPVHGAAFSPDGRWVVSAGPGTAGLWDVQAQQRLLFLDGHDGALLAATFDAPGRTIETVGVDGTMRAYACVVCGRVPALLRLADARLAATGRRLSRSEARALSIR